jgi:hypothetical protein
LKFYVAHCVAKGERTNVFTMTLHNKVYIAKAKWLDVLLTLFYNHAPYRHFHIKWYRRLRSKVVCIYPVVSYYIHHADIDKASDSSLFVNKSFLSITAFYPTNWEMEGRKALIFCFGGGQKNEGKEAYCGTKVCGNFMDKPCNPYLQCCSSSHLPVPTLNESFIHIFSNSSWSCCHLPKRNLKENPVCYANDTLTRWGQLDGNIQATEIKEFHLANIRASGQAMSAGYCFKKNWLYHHVSNTTISWGSEVSLKCRAATQMRVRVITDRHKVFMPHMSRNIVSGPDKTRRDQTQMQTHM